MIGKIFKLFGKKKCLVLSGGAARGFAHIGVIKVLQENNIQFDAVCGTSMGSIIGAMYATGMKWQDMAELARKVNFMKLLKLPKLNMGIIRIETLVNYLSKYILPVKRFDKLKIPFISVCVDIENAEIFPICEGDLVSAVAGSCAIPGIFTPLKYQNRLLVDGGVLANFPVSIAKKYGYSLILGVNVQKYFYKEKIKNVFDILIKAFEMRNMLLDKMEEKECTVFLAPKLSPYSGANFNKAEDIIKTGEEIALEHLNNIKKYFK